jgi:NADH dehydrogenase
VDGEPGQIGFDQLVLAAGSRLALPADQRLHAADTYAQARELQRALGALAETPDDQPRVAVVGGGFTGLELAAELAGTLKPAARTGGHVTLIERDRDLAPGFGPRARRVIEQAMAALGVEVRTGVGVSDLDQDGVMLQDGSRVDAELVVWATGPRAPEITAQIPGRRDGLGRVEVDRFLATGVDGIWAAGDCAAARADGEHIAVMSCQHAIPQGRRAGENAAAAALGTQPRPYRQPLYLTCLDLGDYGALLTCGFDRDTVLATGDQAKKFKRYINRSLIYPPASSDRDHILSMGRPAPAGPAIAALTRLALRSDLVRDRVTQPAPDRASMFASLAGDTTRSPAVVLGDPRQTAT